MSKYRHLQTGRVAAISGGAPNQPLVCLACDVVYSLPYDLLGTWEGYVLKPQIVTPKWIWFAAKGHRELLLHLEADGWLKPPKQNFRGPPNPRGILIDDSQSPAAPELFKQYRDSGLTIWNHRLTAGDQNPLEGRESLTDTDSSVTGARWLISDFRQSVASGVVTETLHGLPYAPGQIILNFAEFEDQEPPGMTAGQVRTAMAGADRLIRTSHARASEDAILDLSVDEIVSAVVMLALLAAKQLRSVSEYRGRDNDSGWGFGTTGYVAPHVI